MQLEKVGFFYELPEDDARVLLRSLVQEAGSPDERAIIQYLLAGRPRLITPGCDVDILDESRPFLDGLTGLTDGVWLWPRSLACWLEKYHLALPPAFLSHIRENNYVVPAASRG